MARMREQLDHEAQPFGIQVVDVRIRRADLPEQNSQAVYQRMQTERQREAAEFRAQGSQKSQEIRARADRDVTVLLAEANSQAEQVRGEGDSERNRIFADAYNRDPDFFAFYRSMQAYEKSLQHGDTRLVLRAGFGFLPLLLQSVGHGPARKRQPTPRRPTASPAPAARQASQEARVPRPGMSDFLAAIGLFFAIEGILFAAFPHDRETRDGCSPRHAGQPTADHGPRFGGLMSA